jgi:hypothetical protein
MFSLQRFFQLRSIGYLELGKRVYHKVIEAECSEHAAAMAFYILVPHTNLCKETGMGKYPMQW